MTTTLRDASPNMPDEDPHSRDALDDDADEPARLLCPITRAAYRDPVFVPSSGNTYERDALEEFWRRSPGPARDPLTNEPVMDRKVYTNWDKRREVAEWLSANPTRTPSGWETREQPTPKKERDGAPNGRMRMFGGENAGGGGARRAVTIGAVVALALLAASAFGGVASPSAWWTTGARGGARGSPRMPPIDEFGVVREIKAPVGSRIRAKRVDRGSTPALEIAIPSQSMNTASLLFSIPWFAITGTWTYGAWNGANPLFASFSLPFWAVGFNMIHQSATSAFESTRLLLTADRFYLEKTIFDRRMFFLRGSIDDIEKSAVETYAYVNGVPQTNLVLYHGIKSHVLARGLHATEDEFIVDEIHRFLKKYRTKRSSSSSNCGGDVKIDTTTPYFARARM